MRRSPALPWDGEAQRADRIILGGIVFSGLYALAVLPAIPYLLTHHPLLLETIFGSTTAMVTMGAESRVGDASLVVVVLAAFPGCMLFDWLYWWAGRRWGHRAVHLLIGRRGHAEGVSRTEARIDRIARRFGGLAVVLAYFLPVPNIVTYATAGLSGMRFRVFVVLDLIGTGLWIAAMVGLGYALGQRAVDVVDAIDHYSLLVTIGLVVAIIGYQVWRQARRRRRPAPRPDQRA